MPENAKVHILENKKWYGLVTVVLVLLIVSISLYEMGYRFKGDLTLGKLGQLSMSISLPLTSIFIDQSEKITTTKDNETITLPFSPTKHSVIISHDGYFPWKKDFVIESNKTLNLFPIFVSQNATGEIITKNDPDYLRIRNGLVTVPSPDKLTPLFSVDKSASIWLEDNAVMAKIGDKIINVIQPDTIVRNLSFYKDRSDVVMFSTLGSVFVIEIDEKGNQNFMPVYRGQKPLFMKTDSSFIYVLDGEVLMQVVI
ncbi:MAG: hypothetical protein A3H52_00740 [Candidatus Zambryskibacteria bacterium RIFCSPLOWO2_02_FULL_39_26]|uniref:PEGA domain-containing protein n=1 Tax=Candidatus Zambryskibacteria bacterium RIFCSPLOWO2_12_FULL_39_23 TaxID=1802776 RepID=A0A1G2UTB3_9BACT|nr:MAG: hypothetical protein A2W51_00590 [Candidatus Zambryskibacteria bacterium RIFCSPHIGHO2_02_39_10]OHA99842.1 MAG: hypothetical protein A3E59_02270 [Candidatus Zambryskibacteria bacterium RIFCSPHIGHO2_12_FULL_39_47]OHB10247.1 MAG: hypothetical protein A3H52_00740 [Candidatus Zambryskibacteria bacterium RIFCSPLOWO2_02_FULL_39_26]OHB12586.1 MAG: hypothetical protein A3G99_02075 [Candidatus Zambryskibacteria bacterium RIFCSPLOWO2_12_FULL_39_23]